MSNIQSFYFQNHEVRTIKENQSIWFTAKDVCDVLGIINHRDAVSKLDEDEVGKTDVIDGLGRIQQTIIINESGLYALILRSNKPNARPFRKWVTSEVLPSIRKTGSYGVAKADNANIIKDRYITLLEKHNDLLIDIHLYKEQLRNARKVRPISPMEKILIKEMIESGRTTGEIAQDLDRGKTTIRKYRKIFEIRKVI